MKKKLLLYLVLSIMLLTFPFNAFSENVVGNELQFELIDVYEEGNEIKVEGIFINVSNKVISNLFYYGIDVYDKDSKYLESYEWENDNDLQKITLQPGEFDYYEFILLTELEYNNLEDYLFEFSMEYEIVGTKFTSGTHVVVNNQQLKTDVAPAVINGRTLVPMRAIFEQLEVDVTFNEKTNTVTATKGDITITHKIGENTLNVNGEKVLLDVSSQLINNRTMVPLRAISESFGCFVTWGKADQALIISIID